MTKVDYDLATNEVYVVPSTANEEKVAILTKLFNADIANKINWINIESEIYDKACELTNEINKDIELQNKFNLALRNHFMDITTTLDYIFAFEPRVFGPRKNLQLFKTKDLIKKYRSLKGNHWEKYKGMQRYVKKYLVDRSVTVHTEDAQDLAKAISITARNLPTIESEIIDLVEDEVEEEAIFNFLVV